MACVRRSGPAGTHPQGPNHVPTDRGHECTPQPCADSASARPLRSITVRGRLDEPVSGAAEGSDALGADLVAQVTDVDLDDVRARIVVVAPDMAEQLLAAQDLAGMTHEH